jgi:hypothetical protein
MFVRTTIRIALGAFCLGLLPAMAAAETTTTTTTVTHPDGSTTQTVEETTSTESTETAAQPQAVQPRLIGPAGATGVIRRSDRRQDRRAGDPRID